MELQSEVSTASNCWTAAQDATATALSQSAAFQSMVEASDEAAGRKKICFDHWLQAWDGETLTKKDAEELIGGAMVRPPPDAPYVFGHINGKPAAAGQFEIKLIRLVRDIDSDLMDENDRIARNWIGSIVEQLSAWFLANNGRDWAGPINVDYGPNHRPQKMRRSAGHVYESQLSFPWGHPQLRQGAGG